MAKNQLKKTVKYCQKWPRIVENGQKMSNMAKNQSQKTAKSCQKWPKIVQYGQKSIEEYRHKLSKMAKNCPKHCRNGQKLSKMVKIKLKLS